MQLRFASLAVINSREDLHLQECAHAGRTKKNRPGGRFAEKRDAYTTLAIAWQT